MTQQTTAPGGEVVLFQSPEGDVQIDVRLEQETVWLSLNQIADLFARDKSVISRHLRNVYFTGELEREATVAKIATTAAVSYTHLRAHETVLDLVCRLLLENKITNDFHHLFKLISIIP